MSGGSFDYLFAKSPEDMMGMQTQLNEMVGELTASGAPDAAAETYELLLMVKQYTVRAGMITRRLEGVWKAAEWVRSGDSSPEYLKRELIKYRGELKNGKDV